MLPTHSIRGPGRSALSWRLLKASDCDSYALECYKVRASSELLLRVAAQRTMRAQTHLMNSTGSYSAKRSWGSLMDALICVREQAWAEG